ncbi:MAG: hypothetical protein HYT42_01640 [Candidatus Sungbacteria bacterium]|uniref:Uncharacterized protein n=1 Tax=Candidatus Sungiibacteriota bacterium TaxID=2750080 RepID=A0A933DRF1_9BACT|nr:hypothetical protein [Candidatus Sungbacteria bacterium]MBI4132266.1 hypothetical protein [Candidatus Sungbacteria bacterium]
MNNCYVADVGDFGKYGLLHHLCPDLKLGVIWYLTPDRPCGETDGKLKETYRYLNLPEGMLAEPYRKGEKQENEIKFKSCDQKLYDDLRGIVIDCKRDVVEIERSKVIFSDTFSDTTFYDKRLSEDMNADKRSAWLEGACKKIPHCDVVFLDPDNGIASKGSRNERSIKHATLDEMKGFYDDGKRSLIVYHQCGRHKKAPEQINDLRDRIKIGLGQTPHVLWYHRGTARFFFIIPSKKHRAALEGKLRLFEETGWFTHGHFTHHG